MKQKQIKMNYVVGGVLQKEITIANNFVTRAYEIYREKKIEDKELLTNIIKVMVSKEEGLNDLLEGIEFEGRRFKPLITSPGMQKKEEEFNGEDYKLEYLFIEESEKDFKDILERLLSGNKINQFKEESKSMCLVKDISARLGLATTGTYRINYKPYMVIVDEATYIYSGKYSFYTDNKIVEDTLERKYILNDGGGLMSNRCAEEIAFNLDAKHKIDFAIIRGYKGLAIKGVTLRFDFAKYFKENYQKDFGNDDDSKFGFRLINGSYEIKDIFGKWHNIDKIDLLLNKSQTKWAKNWDSIEELESEYNNNFYNDYRSILDCFYVSKVNKDPNKLKTHTKINYQVIQNTCLTGEDLIELGAEDINYYKRLIKFKDIDAVRLFLGDLAHDEDNKKVATISDKLTYMLKKQGEDAFKLKWVRRQINRLVRKKINQLAGGKINLVGGYKICALDPIAYCNFLLNGNTGDNGLDENEFYIAGQEGKRVMYRNPIAMYQEIQKINLTNKLDKYLKDYTPELIFFNSKDDTLFKLSTADLDGDGVGIIDNTTLYECVVDEEYPFINIDDDVPGEPHVFTDEQLYKDIILSSGNIIGKIALNNSKLNMICRSVDNSVINDKEVYTYKMLREKYIENKNNKLKEKFGEDLTEEQIWNIESLTDEQKEKMKKAIDKLRKKDNVKKVSDYNNKSIRLIIARMFKLHKETYSNILLASQLSIDMPKTLKPVPDAIMDKFAWLQFIGKPVFMHYLGKCDCKGKGKLDKCESIIHWGKDGKVKKKSNMMDIFCNHVAKELHFDESWYPNGSETIKELINIMDYNCCEAEANLCMESIIMDYNNGRKRFQGDNGKLDLNDLETLRALENLNMTDDKIVANLKEYRKLIDVRFIFMFCWNTYKRKVEEQSAIDAWSYEKDKEGDIDWMYNRYKKIENVTFKEKDERKELLEKTNNLVRVRFGGLTITDIKDKEININNGEYTDKNGQVHKQVKVIIDGEMIGYVFNDKADLVSEDKKYKVLSFKPDNNKRNATVELEVI